MAKSARSTISKRNSVKRRDTVHKPVEDERLQRLSEKLLAIAEEDLLTDSTNSAQTNDAMDVVQGPTKAPTSSTYKKRTAKGKVSRTRHARNAMIFPSLRKHTTKQAGKDKRKV